MGFIQDDLTELSGSLSVHASRSPAQSRGTLLSGGTQMRLSTLVCSHFNAKHPSRGGQGPHGMLPEVLQQEWGTDSQQHHPTAKMSHPPPTSPSSSSSNSGFKGAEGTEVPKPQRPPPKKHVCASSPSPSPISRSHLKACSNSGFPSTVSQHPCSPRRAQRPFIPRPPAAEGGPKGMNAEMPRQVGGWEAKGE